MLSEHCFSSLLIVYRETEEELQRYKNVRNHGVMGTSKTFTMDGLQNLFEGGATGDEAEDRTR